MDIYTDLGVLEAASMRTSLPSWIRFQQETLKGHLQLSSCG